MTSQEIIEYIVAEHNQLNISQMRDILERLRGASFDEGAFERRQEMQRYD